MRNDVISFSICWGYCWSKWLTDWKVFAWNHLYNDFQDADADDGEEEERSFVLLI